MASMIGDPKQLIMERLERPRADIAGGGDPEEVFAGASRDIEALCDETDRLYRDAVSSMW